MANRRVSRVAEQMRREITEILRHEVRDPRIGLVTITDVRVTSDLDQARIRVSLPGEAEEREAALTGLHAAAPYIRTELSKRMRIRRVPELRFDLDDSLSHVRRIDELIAEIQRTRPPDAEPEDGVDGEAQAHPGDDDVA
jgi:ribosome-binding factor A